MIENKFAIQKLSQNLIFGVGLSGLYRPSIYGLRDTLRHYIHNGYLWVFLKTGLIGFIPFIWFYVAFMIKGLRQLKKITNDFHRAVLLGFMLCNASLLIIGFFIPIFVQNLVNYLVLSFLDTTLLIS